MPNAEELYKKILGEAQNDENIIGFWLDGSRGKGMITANSDHDCKMVVKDELEKEYKEKYKTEHNTGADVGVMSLSEFREYAKWGSETAWDRYNFTRLKAAVDKTGEIQKLIDAKGVIPPEKIRELIEFSMGCYLNRFYRSLKCFRDGNVAGARFEAAESVFVFLDALFAMEGRIKPYYKYLEFELKNYPLKESPFEGGLLIANLLKILETGDLALQKEIFKWTEKTFRANGYNRELDGWQGYFDKLL